MDRAMDLFKQMKRNKRVRPDIVTYNLLISGWAREMKRMDMAENVMQYLMNDRDVFPDERTFGALINGYNHLLHEVEIGELSGCTIGCAGCETYESNRAITL